MPCKYNCVLCKQNGTPLPQVKIKNEQGMDLVSVRPGCHPSVILGAFTMISISDSENNEDVLSNLHQKNTTTIRLRAS